jgi:hypothetical protein
MCEPLWQIWNPSLTLSLNLENNPREVKTDEEHPEND